MTKNILIIGGNRFFGKHLATHLIQQGHRPVLFNRQSVDDGLGNQVERMKGDRDDYDQLHDLAFKKNWDIVYDQVCFTAGQARSVVQHFQNRVGLYVVTSSQSVYDYGEDIKESAFNPHRYQFQRDVDRLLDYGEAKRQMEAIFYQKASFPVIAVRFPLVLGKDDYTKRLSWHFDKIKSGQVVYFPNLKARLNYIQSSEAGRVLSELGKTSWMQPLNVASEGVMSIQDLLQEIEKRTGKAFRFDTQKNKESISSYGVSNDWFMNLDQLKSLGIQTSSLQSWLPALLDYETQKLAP